MIRSLARGTDTPDIHYRTVLPRAKKNCRVLD